MTFHRTFKTKCFTKKKEEIVNENIQKKIGNNFVAKQAAEEMIKLLEIRSQDYRNKQQVITKSIAKFANFLKNNAIIYYNDSFKDYLELFIEYEMWMNNGNDSEGNIYKLRKTLKACEEEKQILENAINAISLSNSSENFKSKDVFETLYMLHKLKIT